MKTAQQKLYLQMKRLLHIAVTITALKQARIERTLLYLAKTAICQ